jgi:hypothetical protein
MPAMRTRSLGAIKPFPPSTWRGTMLMPKVPADKWAKNSLRLILPCFEFGNELLEFGNDLFGFGSDMPGHSTKGKAQSIRGKKQSHPT